MHQHPPSALVLCLAHSLTVGVGMNTGELRCDYFSWGVKKLGGVPNHE